ncbi:cadmium resistance transporter (or sequestration) family protein [Marinilactibacillus piezotolerans]|uniref:Cadmium resistance transporter (Or sequestration) family protein n=1 Tax=Marinilactibacillus piezotolerans TaxID=258723 RepID=A0A1I3VIQ8_9LACT|nr:CadD family cadmium resistance transporter [Marinilactibacillus piezotolerans]SFJ95050.1 cadmium resistance transporter (or sequestration) family protein [Marinilactibacillus piezotolerans]
MIQTVLSAIAVYISTSIDYLFILMIIFSQSYTRKGLFQIYSGQYIGTGILVAVSLFAAYVLNFIPQDWLIGLLGLIPIFLGVRIALLGESEEEEGKVVEKLEQRGSTRLLWIVTLLTIASGGDNLGIYIPYFTSLSFSEIIVILIVFFISTFLLCQISYKLVKISFVSETIEKYERIIVPVVFIGLGLYIMLENGTINTLLYI